MSISLEGNLKVAFAGPYFIVCFENPVLRGAYVVIQKRGIGSQFSERSDP